MDLPTINILGLMSGVASVMKVLIIVSIISAVGFFVYWYGSYKHIFITRQLTGTKKSIITDRWKIWKDPRTKIEYLRLFKKKDILPLPPDDAIEIKNNGKFLVEAYRDAEGEYTYIVDNDQATFFQPFTTNQRMILASQINKANSKGGNKFMENLPIIIGLSFIIIIFFGFITNMEEISKPSIDAKKIELSIVTAMADIVNTQNEINQNLQKIGGAVGVEDSSQAPN